MLLYETIRLNNGYIYIYNGRLNYAIWEVPGTKTIELYLKQSIF